MRPMVVRPRTSEAVRSRPGPSWPAWPVIPAEEVLLGRPVYLVHQGGAAHAHRDLHGAVGEVLRAQRLGAAQDAFDLRLDHVALQGEVLNGGRGGDLDALDDLQELALRVEGGGALRCQPRGTPMAMLYFRSSTVTTAPSKTGTVCSRRDPGRRCWPRPRPRTCRRAARRRA